MKEEKKHKSKKLEEKAEDEKEINEEIRKEEEYLNNWKRCQADLENFRKEAEKKMAEFREYANLDLIYQLIPVLDNFESSLSHVPEEKTDNGWVQGILYIKKQLEDVLKNNGVEEIVIKEGAKFDHNLMEAAPGSKEDGTKVEKVIQKGYRFGERVIRAARVMVS